MMKAIIGTCVLSAGLLLAATSFAQTPAGAPAGSTGLCKDGTYYSGAIRKGACRGHKGVKEWYAAEAAAPASSTKAASAAAAKSAAPAAAATAPAGATGMCKDGTYYTGATKKGACRGHKGVQDWYAAGTANAAGTATKAATAASAAPATAAAAAPAPAAAASAAQAPAAARFTPSSTPAAGGGPRMVWINSSSKVYHCTGDRWYGKTKSGEYMSEADAKAKGNRPDHGKGCQ